jgi:hypothetical protein
MHAPLTSRRFGDRPEDRLSKAERVLFVVTVIYAGAMLWLAPRLPMVDLPQHAGQVAALHDLWNGQSEWEHLLRVNYFTPYLAGYGLALPLSFFMPVAAALKLLLTLAYYGFVLFCVLLRRRLGADERLDWLFVPGFFGYSYAWGFYSFLVAAPLGLLSVILARRYADRPAPGIGVLLFLAGVVLFFSHGLMFLFANAIGVAFVALKRRRLARLVPALLPYAALSLLCAAYALTSRSDDIPLSPNALGIVWGWDWTRLFFPWFVLGASSHDWYFGAPVLLMLYAPRLLDSRLNRQAPAAFVPIAITLIV